MSRYEDEQFSVSLEDHLAEYLSAPTTAQLTGRQLAQALADAADLHAKLQTAEALAESYRLGATRDASTYHREWQAALEREGLLRRQKEHLERIQGGHAHEMRLASNREAALRGDLADLVALAFESDEENSVILKAVRAKLLPYRDADEGWTGDR